MCNINTTGLSSYCKEGQILFEKKCLTCEKDVGDLMKKKKLEISFCSRMGHVDFFGIEHECKHVECFLCCNKLTTCRSLRVNKVAKV